MIRAFGHTPVPAGLWSNEFDDLVASVAPERRRITVPKGVRLAPATRFRVYAREGRGLILRHRFDRDPPRHVPNSWLPHGPDGGINDVKPDAIIVTRVGPGPLGKDLGYTSKIAAWLRAQNKTPIFLHSRGDADFLAEMRGAFDLLVLTRQGLGELTQESLAGITLMREVEVDDDKKQHRFHPRLIEALDKVKKQLLRAGISSARTRGLLIRLDEEGGLLVTRDSNDIFNLHPLPAPSTPKWERAPIGGGDFVMSTLTDTIGVKTWGDTEKLKEAAGNAVWAEHHWGVKCRAVDWSAGGAALAPTGIAITSEDAVIVRKACEFDASVADTHTVEEAVKYWDNASKEPQRLEELDVIRLYQAGWFLQRFTTVHDALGSDLAGLARTVLRYVARSREPGGEKLKPFVIAVCGGPGSGKTTMATALADLVKHAEFLETNVAQWTGYDGLHSLCDTIRESRLRSRFPIAFIDEVDADLGGEKVYGRLLEPTGSGKYTVGGHERRLGPTIFIMAGSGDQWVSGAALLATVDPKREPREGEEAPGKLRDLVSRLSYAPLSIPALTKRPADGVYLVADRLKARFPRVRWISRRVFEYLAPASLIHGPRSAVKVIEMFARLKDPKVVRLRDLTATGGVAVHVRAGKTRSATHLLSLMKLRERLDEAGTAPEARVALQAAAEAELAAWKGPEDPDVDDKLKEALAGDADDKLKEARRLCMEAFKNVHTKSGGHLVKILGGNG